MPSYPTEAWKQLSPEDKEVMREIKAVFGNVEWTGTTAPEGVIPFKVQDRTGKRYTE